jgi:ATP-dependent DNA helicase RecQ
MTSPIDILVEQFGFTEFREGQEPVIDRLLDGKSVLAIFPTGAGKSLCYQLPALMLDGLTLVISPLIALMKDQIDFLKSKGVAAERLDSTLELPEYRRVLNELNAGRLKLLYVAPERLASERFLQTLKRLPIAMIAIDEAHCISEWGHNFRPDYMKLAKLARDLQAARVLALTATAPPGVASDIARAFNIAEGDVVKTPFHRKNLVLRVTPVPASDPPARMNLLLERIRSRTPGPTIVYVTLQKTAQDVAVFLAQHQLHAAPYHAGMDPDARHAVQDAFMRSDRAIVVATIAFGMGIDKKDIRYVYHYNLPKTLENYAQEIGRAGRDGLESTCELFASPDDRIPLENFTYGDTPSARSLHALLTEIANLESDVPDHFDVSTYELSSAHDIRILVIDTILTYLELDGLIASTGPFYNEYKFQPLHPSNEIIARFDPSRQEFLRAVFKCAHQGKSSFKLDLKHVTQTTGATRQRVIAALNYLEEQGDLNLEVTGARQGYRRLRRDWDVKTLSEKLASRFLEREKRDIQRLDGVLALASHTGCRTARLLDYFGEPLAAGAASCGHCDTCLRQNPGPLAKFTPRPLTGEELNLIQTLKAEKRPAISTPRQLTRFLCGLNSPATTRAKLKSHPAFARLADVPFGAVLDAVKK